MYDDRLRGAAQRVLDGDDSRNAVRDLEGVLLDDYSGDGRFDDLLEACALYAPGMEPPCVGRVGRDAIQQALSAIDADK